MKKLTIADFIRIKIDALCGDIPKDPPDFGVFETNPLLCTKPQREGYPPPKRNVVGSTPTVHAMDIKLEIKTLINYYGIRRVLETLVNFVAEINKNPTESYLTELTENLKKALHQYEARYK